MIISVTFLQKKHGVRTYVLEFEKHAIIVTVLKTECTARLKWKPRKAYGARYFAILIVTLT